MFAVQKKKRKGNAKIANKYMTKNVTKKIGQSPQSKLLYTSMESENFKKCWALENLQPLEAVANRKKHDKIIKS